jgi:hypothetical protein
MEGSLFDESGFFSALAAQGIRYLLVGRQACIAYGLPVLTADYDIAVDRDQVPALVEVAEGFGMVAPEDLDRRALFSLENDEKIDVFCARTYSSSTGQKLSFDEMWARRRSVPLRPGAATVQVPHIRDLIGFKLLRPRKKDLEDVKALEIIAGQRGE